MDDRLLLQQYTRDNSEWAFQRLVERHLDLVYAAAVRRLNDQSMAQDVAQVVFLILAKKAKTLPADVILPGWLYRTTYFVASKALRSERRRKYHERQASEMQQLSASAPDNTWKKLAPFLDELLMRLGDKDRNAVLLRYFEEKDLASVGMALGMSEDAAQKRVSRALDKLRRLIGKRGLVMPGTLLGTTLAAHGAEAPPALRLTQSVVMNCLQKGVIQPHTYGLLQDSLRQFLWKKMLKTAATLVPIAACILVLIQKLPADAKETPLAYSGPKNNSGAPPVKKVIQPVRAAYQANPVMVSSRSVSAPAAQPLNVSPVNSVPGKSSLLVVASKPKPLPTNQLAAASPPTVVNNGKTTLSAPVAYTGMSFQVSAKPTPTTVTNQTAIAIFPELPQPNISSADFNFTTSSRGQSSGRAPSMNRKSTPTPVPIGGNRRQVY